MIVTLQTRRLQSLVEVRSFRSGNESVDFVLVDRGSSYEFVRETLVKFRYWALPRRDKGVIRSYLMKMIGKSESQVTRLIPAAPGDRQRSRPPRPAASRVQAALHEGRHRASGRGRCGTGPSVRTRDARRHAADVRGVRRRALRAPGDHLERPVLQPAQVDRLPAAPHQLQEDAVDPRSGSENDASPSRRGSRATCGWTRCTKGTKTARRACTTSTSWTRCCSGSTWQRYGPSPNGVSCRCSRSSSSPAPSRCWASTPTTAPSTSTARSPRCSTNCTSPSSPSPAAGTPTTTPWSRARTAT